ncbi:MAG: hypothetical protein V4659_03990 [Pseudomonadota bacterium]
MIRPRVSTIVPRGLTASDLSDRLVAMAEQAVDAESVSVTLAPFDLLRVARLIKPVGTPWPRPAFADVLRARYLSGVRDGLFAGAALIAVVLGLWWTE